ncbi:phage tail protein [Ralstonia solanacearum]|uniref:phage tail protein n=1 Tax=Ralstonia solanacearum TaxID=305 RepID=UPI000E66FC94|nr:phage tail protein [Ralstonia solanacearum]RIJ85014.1 phage tail protein [Ralstonia solanacearum]
MIDAYLIGTTVKLNDLITPGLVKLEAGFKKLDSLALQVNKRLQKMGSEVIGVRNLAIASQQVDVALKGVSNQALKVGQNLRKIQGTVAKGGIGLEAELARANVEADSLARKIAAMRAAGRVPGGGVNPILPPPGGGRGGRGGRYGGHIHGGNMHVGPNGFGIGGVGMGMSTNMLVPLAAAGATVYVGHQLYEAAKDYEMAFARFRTLNLGDAVNKDADAFARGTKQFGVSMVERMTILRDMHEVMGHYGEAKAVTPLFSRMLAANRGVFGEEGNKFDTKTFQALGKVIELRGGTSSEAEMFKQADFAQKTLTGSAGLVTPTDMLAFMKTGGVAARLLSNKAFYEESAPMIQEMGGSRFGTALMSAHQNLAMGRGALKSMQEAARLGLIDPRMIEYTKIGTIKQVLPGALVNEDLYNQSKLQWLLQVLIPAIRNKGIRGKDGIIKGDAITDDQIVNELNTIFSQRTASNAFSQMYLQRHKIEKNIAVTEGAMGIKELEDLYKKSPQGAEDEFMAAWKDFKTEFGKNVLPAATEMLKDGASILRSIAGASEAVKNSSSGQTFADVSKGALSFLSWPYRMMSGNAEAKPINPVAGKGQSMVQVKTDIKLDGRVIAEATSLHQAKELARPQTGPGTFDSVMNLRPVGLR